MTITARQVGGNADDYTSGSLREDLANFITLTSPTKTPLLSMASTVKATQPHHEWQTDSLSAPIITARAGDVKYGDLTDKTYTAKRIGNYTQTHAGQVSVDGSTMKSNIAGAKNWFMHEVDKVKLELRRNAETKAIIYRSNTNAEDVVSDPASTRKAAGIAAYAGIVNLLDATGSLEYNDRNNSATAITGGGNGVALNVTDVIAEKFGDVVVQLNEAPTDVVLTLDHINSVFSVVSSAGGDVNMMMVPVSLKNKVSKLLIDGNGGAAQRRASEMASRIKLYADSILTDYGQDVTIMHNYLMDESAAQDASATLYFYDVATIRRAVLEEYDMEIDGTARKGKAALMFMEECVEVKDPTSMAFISNAKAA